MKLPVVGNDNVRVEPEIETIQLPVRILLCPELYVIPTLSPATLAMVIDVEPFAAVPVKLVDVLQPETAVKLPNPKADRVVLESRDPATAAHDAVEILCAVELLDRELRAAKT